MNDLRSDQILTGSIRFAQRTRTSLLLAVACLSLATGCHKKTSGIDPNSLGPTGAIPSTTAAPTASITADPVAVELGKNVVLNWRTTNATIVTIDGIGQVSVNGTQTVTPSSSTNFHLTAKGDGGTTEANVRVTVRAASASTAPATGLDDASSRAADAAFHAAVQDVFFDYDSFDLRPDAETSAAQAAAYLVAHPGVRVLIGGYCDERGSAEYNLALGENRAHAAEAALINAGVAQARIRIISYGKEKQFCTQADESCYQENRRAQFNIDR